MIAQHPDIKEFTSITSEQQKAIEKTAIDLFARLITQDCKSEFISVIKYEPEQGIFISFKTLGEVSMMTLMSNSVVQEAAVNFSEQLDSNGAIEKLIEQTKTQETDSFNIYRPLFTIKALVVYRYNTSIQPK